jgi:hypothetical protein
MHGVGHRFPYGWVILCPLVVTFVSHLGMDQDNRAWARLCLFGITIAT